jgi:serine/threonine protein kinase, bacterial
VQGTILGSRYQVIEYIGKGGFGKTYLAIDTQLPGKDQCVVKQLYPSVDDPNFLQIARRLFKKEAETLHSLGRSHAQIPYLLAYFEQEEKFYLVQQYIEGHTLSKELAPDRLWSETQVIELLQDCLNILDFIHAKGVIHRDVKPDNLIRRTADNKLVLVDFGTVKEVILEQSQILPSTVAVGTKGYMPTEQARGKPRIASDIYALGVIAIQALTGIPPLMLEEDDEGELIWQSQANVSPQLAEIITKMTRYHFKNRYQSAKEVLASLKTLNNNGVGILKTETVLYTPTVQLNSIVNPSNFPSIAQVQPISNFNDQSNLVMPSQTTNSNVLPSSAIAASQIPETPNLVIKNNSTKIKNLSKNKTLVNLGIALLVGLIAAGGMYWLKGQTEKKAQSSLETQVDELNQMLARKNYTECYERALKMKAEDVTTKVMPEVQREGFETQCGLGKAREQAQSLNFIEALAIAKSLPRQTSAEAELTTEIDLWSEKALEQATELYQKEGKLQEALEVVKEIPQDTPVKQKALDTTETWKTELETNKVIIAAAQKALSEEKWQDAQTEALKITSSSSDYWQQQAQAVIKEAKEKIAATVKPATPASNPTVNTDKKETDKIKSNTTPSVEPPLQNKRIDQGGGFRDEFNEKPSQFKDELNQQPSQFRDELNQQPSIDAQPEQNQFREDL